MTTEKNQVNDDFGLDDDDDFGDFGGFEVAEPVVPQVAQPGMPGMTATPSPWALFPGVQPTAEQDTSVPPGGESSILSDQPENLTDVTEATFSLTKTATTTETTPPTFRADSDSNLELDHDQKTKETPVPEATKQNNDIPAGSAAVALKETSTNVGQNKPLSKQPMEKLSTSDSKIQGASVDTDESHTDGRKSVDTSPRVESTDHLMAQPSEQQKQKLSQLQTTLGTVQAERDILRKELESVTSNQERWNQDLQDCKEQLEQQIKKYDTLQVIHTEALSEMRKAGHDALSVIIAEYKELSRKAVLQQQELSQQDIKEALTEEATRWQLQLKEQREHHVEDLERLKSQIQEELKNTLETGCKEQQSTLEKTLESERQKHKEAMAKAVQEERERSEEALQEALQAERVKMKALLKEEQDKFQGLIAEEREKSASVMKEATTAEQLRCEQCMKKAVEDERQRGESRVQEVMEHVQKEMKSYVAEQKLADDALRRRQWTSIDLFLECSRKQLDMLLSDPPPGSGDTKFGTS